MKSKKLSIKVSIIYFFLKNICFSSLQKPTLVCMSSRLIYVISLERIRRHFYIMLNTKYGKTWEFVPTGQGGKGGFIKHHSERQVKVPKLTRGGEF